MNKNPKPVPKVKYPPRVDSGTLEFFDKIPNALSYLVAMDEKAWAKTLPLRGVDSIKFTLGTDGGISLYYDSRGTQYQYHVIAEHFGLEPLVKYEGPGTSQPGELTKAGMEAAKLNTVGDRSEDELITAWDAFSIESSESSTEEKPDVSDSQNSDIRSEPPAQEVPT